MPKFQPPGRISYGKKKGDDFDLVNSLAQVNEKAGKEPPTTKPQKAKGSDMSRLQQGIRNKLVAVSAERLQFLDKCQ